MKSFNKITKGLRKTISQLESLGTYNAKESELLEEKIRAYQVTITDLGDEGLRAQDTATKLKALIGD